MYFKSVIRFSPEHGKELSYYKIKESFRDVAGHVHTQICSDPTEAAAEIYRQLGYKSQPFKRYTIKSSEPPN